MMIERPLANTVKRPRMHADPSGERRSRRRVPVPIRAPEWI
jgi:hypothetical protein